MNPQEIFCPNIDCHARGQIGKAKNVYGYEGHDLLLLADRCPDGDVGDHAAGLGLILGVTAIVIGGLLWWGFARKK